MSNDVYIYDNSEASIEQTDLIKPSSASYVVRAVNGAVVKVTNSLDEAITTAVQFREMKQALGVDAHCNVEQKVIVYSTMNNGVKLKEAQLNPFRNF